MEERVAGMAASVIDDLEAIKLHSERIVGDLFEEGSDHGPAGPSIPMAAPDTGSSPRIPYSTHATLQFTYLLTRIVKTSFVFAAYS